MKVGDLVEWCDRAVGIVTHISENGDPFVLFVDGEFQVCQDTVEVISENR
tara:strand:+ start:29 stop:178 length:150 start_codon:yes stop_codon:yes gene_type:complete